ncbi:hypothetical protein CVIRNUC_008596 [Coccomyxa viridis]|uniref:SnoaL-like domain-containing protein n=1 Tax=Coccomyxa viridis TaxID=1274662 RepID=A0AAV1IDK3_9CHLO|nr:hypothetical protein CVIRNUC_008596 [Coccomyxa viridis]
MESVVFRELGTLHELYSCQRHAHAHRSVQRDDGSRSLGSPFGQMQRVQSTFRAMPRPYCVAHASTTGWADAWGSQSVPMGSGWLGKEWFACFNRRDKQGMLSLLSDDCQFESLALQETFDSPQAISRLLDILLQNLSQDVQHVVESIADGQSSAVAVLWHVRARGASLLHAKGITFMKINDQDQICFIRDAPEHPFKQVVQTAPVANLAISMLASTPSLWPMSAGSTRELPDMQMNANSRSPDSSLNQWGSTTEQGPSGQDLPSTVPRLQAELQRARGERDALETRLKLLLQARRAAGDSSAAVEASAAAAQLQSTPGDSQQDSRYAYRQRPSSPSRARSTFSESTARASKPQESSTAETSQNLSGVWIKDANRSDLAAYERALDLMGLNGLQKTTALRLIEGVEIQQDATTFSVNFLTVVPFFKVTEKYSFTGETSMARRDLRTGQQSAKASLIAEGVRLSITWGEPNAANIEDIYRLQAADVLEVASDVSVGGRSVVTTQVYKKQDRWRPRFTWSGGLFG